ncbi:GAF and ANTAR domain-containing protein [Nocardioides pacificus]
MYDQQNYVGALTDYVGHLAVSPETSGPLSHLAVMMTGLFALDGVAVGLADNGRLSFPAVHGAGIAAIEHAQEQSQAGPGLVAYQTGRVVPVHDLPREHARWPAYCAAAATVDIASVASLPLHTHDQTLGAIDLCSRSPRDWLQEDLDAAALVADVTTLFLLNAMQGASQVNVIAQLQHALVSRVIIEQAKGVLSAKRNISTDQAFERIRLHARSHQATVTSVANAVVLLGLNV